MSTVKTSVHPTPTETPIDLARAQVDGYPTAPEGTLVRVVWTITEEHQALMPLTEWIKDASAAQESFAGDDWIAEIEDSSTYIATTDRTIDSVVALGPITYPPVPAPAAAFTVIEGGVTAAASDDLTTWDMDDLLDTMTPAETVEDALARMRATVAAGGANDLRPYVSRLEAWLREHHGR